jgi:pimeloyl-ACP methyl ester carboxylesterase
MLSCLVHEARALADDEESARVPRLRWSDCGEDYPNAECARVEVPLDYDRPWGASTPIALARIPASDQKHKLGTVFINPGGPGGSGVGLALDGFGELLAMLLEDRFDVVGFDPRGVAASNPIQCFDRQDELDAFFARAPLFPYRHRQERPFFELYSGLWRECAAQRQAITRHMSTADVARDLDLLRQAVGDERITYLGFSYGSYLGQTYANLFPSKVRALVIDGVLDAKLWSSGRHIEIDGPASDAELDEFLRLCDEAGPECLLAADGDARGRYADLATALRREPIVFEDGFAYTYDLLVGDTTGALYAPESWGGPGGFGALFAYLAEAALGDLDAASAALQAWQGLQETFAIDPAVYDNSTDAYFGNQCSDTEYPATFAEFREIGDLVARTSYIGPNWWWWNAGCASWPTARDRHAGPWTARTSAPVLVVGNYFDGVTGYAGAVSASKALPNSRLLSYAGWGHTAFGRSDCVVDHVTSYLLEGKLPPRNSVCPANPNPFLPAQADPADERGLSIRLPFTGLPSLRSPRR